MGKNNKFINQMKRLATYESVRRASEKDTPQIYAAIVVALYRIIAGNHDEKQDAINDILVESQHVWEYAIENGLDMVKYCEEETGICVMGKEK